MSEESAESTQQNNRRKTILTPEVMDKMIDSLVLYLQSANLYRTLGLFAKSKGLLGCADYLFIQRKERSHSATNLHKFLDAAGALFVIPDIVEDVTIPVDLEDVFTIALDNEIRVTDLLNDTATFACSTNQHTALVYLHEELKFQLGEESEARDRIAIVQGSDCDVTSDIKIATLIKKRKKKK